MMSPNSHGCKLLLGGDEFPFWPTDTIFEVMGAVGDVDPAATFHAHRFVLQAKAPKLAAKLGPFPKATIFDIDPAIFHLLLRSAYGGGIAEEYLIAHGKSIIDAAHKCGVSDLKLAAEAAYVKSTKITTKNAIDLLLYAEALNLDLLKEVVNDFLAVIGYFDFEENKGNDSPAPFPPMSSAAPKNSFDSTKKEAAAPSPASSTAFPPKNPFTKMVSAPAPASSSAFPPMSKTAPKSPFTSTATAPAPSSSTKMAKGFPFTAGAGGFSFTAPAPTSSSPNFQPMSKTAPKSPFDTTTGGSGLSSTQTGFSFGAKAPAASSSGAP